MQQLKVVNFGKSKDGALGATGVGYSLIDKYGSAIMGRTTNGVYTTAPGIYAALVSVPSNFIGQIVWDTGTYFGETYYASEEISEMHAEDITTSLAIMMSDISFIKAMTAGRWKLLENQMIFYGEDNTTEIARFNLFDNNGVPTLEAVFERTRV